MRREEQSAHTERMIAKYGTLERALDVVGAENYDYRQAAQKDAETIATLKRTQVPDGAVVLSGDDVKHWEKVKATGVPLDKVATTLTRAKELEADKVKADKAVTHAAVAKAAKMDPDVLAPLVEQFGLEVETRTVKVQKGDKLEDVPEAFVRKAGDDKATWEKLADFVARDGSPLKPFAVALKAKATGTPAADGSNGTSSATGSQGDTTHTFPAMIGDSIGDAGDDFVTKRLNARNAANAARDNPLAPVKTPAKT